MLNDCVPTLRIDIAPGMSCVVNVKLSVLLGRIADRGVVPAIGPISWCSNGGAPDPTIDPCPPDEVNFSAAMAAILRSSDQVACKDVDGRPAGKGTL